MEEDITEQNQHHNPIQISNTSLVINNLQTAFHHNQNQIDLMESFIKTKTTEIANLQAYLISQFQAIENSKARNKKIQKILITSTIPMLQQITSSLQSFKKMLLPFSTIAFSFITALASKSQQLLLTKQNIIDQQAEQIKQLKQSITGLTKSKELPQKKAFCSKEGVPVDKQQRKLQIDHRVVPSFQKVVKPKYSPTKSPNINNSQSKTPNKFNKYEQCYKAIQDNKKQIKYHCQRVLAPLQTNIQPKRQGINEFKYQRKDLIKQKIEKIKIRKECRQLKSHLPID